MNQIPAKIRAYAVSLVCDAGCSQRDAAAQTSKKFRRKVSAASVGKWVSAARAGDASPEVSEAYAELTRSGPESDVTPDSDPDAEPGDIYEQTKQMLRDAQKRARSAERDGNHAAAARAGRDAATLAPVVARLEAARKQDKDAVTVPRADLERAKQAMRDRVAALMADLERTGGLVCNGCGRKIRLQLAKGE